MYALLYIQKKFPLIDELLASAKWIDVTRRTESTWENLEYFLGRYSNLLSDVPQDALFDELFYYQTLTDDGIGQCAWKEAKVVDSEEEGSLPVFHYRVDVLWWYIANMKLSGTSIQRFKYLVRVGEVVVILTHNNAEEERLFSIVTKNKTESRS